MFYNNKYTKWYYRIIQNAREAPFVGYVEKHHIIPKCLGGTNGKENIVALTARQHFVCHLLLTKMNDDHRLKFAFFAMSLTNHNQNRNYRMNSSTYEYLKKCNSAASTKRNLQRKYPKGFVVIYDPTTGEEKNHYKGEIPKNWKLGSPKTSAAMIGKNIGKIYYYNPATMDVKSLNISDIIPEGYKKGNPKANSSDNSRVRGSKWFHNKNTGERLRLVDNIPEGFDPGMYMMWIYNPATGDKINHPKEKEIPQGYVKGRKSYSK